MRTKINRDSQITISTQLFEILKRDILQNNWKENARFYSIRQVSIKYDVNPNTVLKVFQTLEEQGYLFSIQGKGSYIKKGYNLDVSERMAPILNTFKLGQDNKKGEINLSNGAPPSEFFPTEAYRKILGAILSDKEESKTLLGYQNIQGLESLRRAIPKYLKKFKINVSKDDIIISTSTQSILSLICTTFNQMPKKNMLLSKPTYQNAVRIFENYYNIENINLLPDGWDMEEFELLLKRKKIDFIYVMTNFQNPTGISWSEKKKRKLLELSLKYDFYIIEDECFCDFYYDGNIPTSLKSIDTKERVFYLKTFSKSVMPGIGLALFIPPKSFLEKFSLNKYFVDTTTSGMSQKFLEIYIKNGMMEEHLEKLREIFSEKMEYVINKLNNIPHLRITHIPKGGFFLWIELANYIDGEKFYYKCRLRGLSILPGFLFDSTGRTSCNIRISIVSANLDEIDAGLDIIADILKHCNGIPKSV